MSYFCMVLLSDGSSLKMRCVELVWLFGQFKAFFHNDFSQDMFHAHASFNLLPSIYKNHVFLRLCFTSHVFYITANMSQMFICILEKSRNPKKNILCPAALCWVQYCYYLYMYDQLKKFLIGWWINSYSCCLIKNLLVWTAILSWCWEIIEAERVKA